MLKKLQEEAERPSSLSLNVEETEAFSANRCVNEITKPKTPTSPSDIQEKFEPTAPEPDPGTFVTVIEVNGLKQGNTTPVKSPPPK